MKIFFITLILAAVGVSNNVQAQISPYGDLYRPQFHFSPKAHWMNDPNGMVYFNGTYHLFFQYYPNATVWGPMHWGHAESKDMIHWEELPIALSPDNLGYIFSGSAVVDSSNTSGFGKNGKIPMVAIFTHHDPKGEKAGKSNYQNQSLAYSLDNGSTWTKYAANPVLKNPGIRDFRDPKVMWYGRQKKWVMTLATKDRISFYSAPDLKNWKKESEFGATIGAHGGVWECPDLFPLKLDGKTYWVLIVNLNPGGPNGGSATQYFIGNFDGLQFLPIDTKTRWVDYGPDEYAGITWGNTGARKIFLGWMSNWDYANQVPTVKWRNAMTIPRELGLAKAGNEILLTSVPVKELKSTYGVTTTSADPDMSRPVDLSSKIQGFNGQYRLDINFSQIKSYTIKLSGSDKDELVIGFDQEKNAYYIDRTKAGKVHFHKGFAGKFTAPRKATTANGDLVLVVDRSSVELFADGGLTTMTAIYFTSHNLNRLALYSKSGAKVKSITLHGIKSIWK